MTKSSNFVQDFLNGVIGQIVQQNAMVGPFHPGAAYKNHVLVQLLRVEHVIGTAQASISY